MKRIFYLALALATAAFMALKLLGINDFDGLYRLMRIAVLVFVCVRCFQLALKTGDKDALFTGTLGLLLLTISELYLLAVILVDERRPGTLGISDLSDAGSYLFFLAALSLLLLIPMRREKALRAGLIITSGFIIVLTLYAVLRNNETLLYLKVTATACLCMAMSAWLFRQSRRIKQQQKTAGFAQAMMFLAAVDIAIYILLLCGQIYVMRVVTALYLPCFYCIGAGLMRLREIENG